MATNALLDLIDRQGVAILDGGLGTQLEARGFDLIDALWSARLLEDDPDAIAAVHRDYLDAGADCIVTASYQANFAGFQARGIGRADAERLLRRSAEIALHARGERAALVAASIGPYGAALADGSEFTGDYDLDEPGLRDWHRDRLRVLADTSVDLLACETVPSFAEARVLADLLDEVGGPPAWVSFSCRDAQHISDGSRLRDCAAFLDGAPAVAAIGINCTAPRLVASLIDEVTSVTNKPVLVYPNAGRLWHAAGRCWVGDAEAAELGELVGEWVARGARGVGGCCGTTPDDIARLRRRMRS